MRDYITWKQHYHIILAMTHSVQVKKEIITKVMDHRNVLGVLPTGGENQFVIKCRD